MVTLPLFKPDYRLIDTSSIMAFSGVDWSNPDRFAVYREKIWSHLETLISADRLKTVPEVWPELEFNDKASWERLYPIHDKFVLPKDGEATSLVLALVFKYGRKFIFSESSHYNRTPADPFLIVYAQKLCVQIITDEKPLAERKGKRKNRKLTIPDVCEAEGMNNQCIYLENFLKVEGVIP